MWVLLLPTGRQAGRCTGPRDVRVWQSIRSATEGDPMEEKHTKPKGVDWRGVRRRVRLWLAPVSAAVYWMGRTVREHVLPRL